MCDEDVVAATSGQVRCVLPVQSTAVLNETVEFFQRWFHFDLISLMPADEPATALLSNARHQRALARHGGSIELVLRRSATAAGGSLCFVLTQAECGELAQRLGAVFPVRAPNGTLIELDVDDPLRNAAAPALASEFHVCGPASPAEGSSWVVGRAGLKYRDLIPSRLGGAMIASHIRIDGAGEVADYVHYHRVWFQLIYCYRGAVRLVYEDQGAPFLMRAGDCVLQPPQIRHRVLAVEDVDGLEVVEVGLPAVHETLVEHDMTLPNGDVAGDPARTWQGSRFVHYRRDERAAGTEAATGCATELGIEAATAGLVRVDVVTSLHADRPFTSAADVFFFFVLHGALTLCRGDADRVRCTATMSVCLPRGTHAMFTDLLPDTSILLIQVPDYQRLIHSHMIQ